MDLQRLKEVNPELCNYTIVAERYSERFGHSHPYRMIRPSTEEITTMMEKALKEGKPVEGWQEASDIRRAQAKRDQEAFEKTGLRTLRD